VTVEDIERAAAGFRFVGGLSMWKPSVQVRRDTGCPVLWLEIAIPDSEDPSCRRMQPLNTGVALDEATLSVDPRTPERFIVDAIAKFFLHEMYESILVRGQRLFDPHVADAYHPGSL